MLNSPFFLNGISNNDCCLLRVCVDFDLCEECEAKPRKDIHEPTHLFIKLKQPAVITPSLLLQGPALTKASSRLRLIYIY